MASNPYEKINFEHESKVCTWRQFLSQFTVSNFFRLHACAGRSVPNATKTLHISTASTLRLASNAIHTAPIHYITHFEFWPGFYPFSPTIHTRKTKRTFVRVCERPQQSSFRAAISG